MWDDFLSKIGAFCKNLVFLAERLDRQATETKDIREEIKTLSVTVVDLRIELANLQSEMRLINERQQHAVEQAENRHELFKTQVGFMLQKAQVEKRTEQDQLEGPDPPRLKE